MRGRVSFAPFAPLRQRSSTTETQRRREKRKTPTQRPRRGDGCWAGVEESHTKTRGHEEERRAPTQRRKGRKEMRRPGARRRACCSLLHRVFVVGFSPFAFLPVSPALWRCFFDAKAQRNAKDRKGKSWTPARCAGVWCLAVLLRSVLRRERLTGVC